MWAAFLYCAVLVPGELGGLERLQEERPTTIVPAVDLVGRAREVATFRLDSLERLCQLKPREKS